MKHRTPVKFEQIYCWQSVDRKQKSVTVVEKPYYQKKTLSFCICYDKVAFKRDLKLTGGVNTIVSTM